MKRSTTGRENPENWSDPIATSDEKLTVLRKKTFAIIAGWFKVIERRNIVEANLCAKMNWFNIFG